jgi:hypothetical protein
VVSVRAADTVADAAADWAQAEASAAGKEAALAVSREPAEQPPRRIRYHSEASLTS